MSTPKKNAEVGAGVVDLRPTFRNADEHGIWAISDEDIPVGEVQHIRCNFDRPLIPDRFEVREDVATSFEVTLPLHVCYLGPFSFAVKNVGPAPAKFSAILWCYPPEDPFDPSTFNCHPLSSKRLGGVQIMTHELLIKRTIWISECPKCGDRTEKDRDPPRERRCTCGTWVPYVEQSLDPERR